MSFEIIPSRFGGQVSGKLGKMRKPQAFSVLPTDDGRIIVQSSKSIGIFDYHGTKGRFTTKGKYFHDLAMAESFDFPAEFVKLCLEVAPALDKEITVGGVTIQTTVKILK